MGTQIRLKWINHQSNLLTTFQQYLLSEKFVDVTICCEGMSLKAHKVILSSSSTYFEKYFSEKAPDDSTFSIKGAKFEDMKSILDFIYNGEVDVFSHSLMNVLRIAQNLKIRGLMEVAEDMNLTIFPQDYSDTTSYIVPEILPPSNDEMEVMTSINILSAHKENDTKGFNMDSTGPESSEVITADIREPMEDLEEQFQAYGKVPKLKKRCRKRKLTATNENQSFQDKEVQNQERSDSFEEALIPDISVHTQPIPISPLNKNSSAVANVDTSIVKSELEIDEESEYTIKNAENSLAFLDSDERTGERVALSLQHNIPNENNISIHFANALAACGPTNFSLGDKDSPELWDESGRGVQSLIMNIGRKPPGKSKGDAKKYRNYSSSEMMEAVRLVREKQMTVYKASKLTGVPWSSLKRFLAENEHNSSPCLKKMGKPFALDTRLEQKLLKYVISMQELGFGLTIKQLRSLAFEVAEAFGHGHFFSKDKKIASKKWWRNFKERYGLKLNGPENISAFRDSMSNTVMLSDFFDKLRDMMTKLNILDKPDHMWNMDETGMNYAVKSSKVVAEIGKRYVYKRTYSESGETCTLVGCVCANGTWIPPFMIFKGTDFSETYKKDMLPNAEVHLSEKGWMTKELFLEWFKFFLRSIGDSTRPLLLLMDSHGSHMTPQILELAEENGIYILTFPAHTTHILQPLHVGIYKALKFAWQQELSQYMLDHPTNRPNRENFHLIFKIPFIKAMSPETIKNAFRICGIVPLDREAIPKEKLGPMHLAECPIPDATVEKSTMVTDQGESTRSYLDHLLKLPAGGEKASREIPQPSKKSQLLTAILGHSPLAETVVARTETLNQNSGFGKSSQQQLDSNLSPGPSKNVTSCEDDWVCGVCKVHFSSDKRKKNGKKWIQCSFCLLTYHELCQSEPILDFIYMCDLCSTYGVD